MKNVGLIAVDLDGTLLDDRKAIHPDNVHALREAHRRGIHVAICSGRMVPRIEPIVDCLGVDCAIIAYNGGKVVGRQADGRRTVLHQPLPADVADRFVRYSRDRGLLLNFYLEDVLYAEDGVERRRFMSIYSGRTGAEYQLTDLTRFAGLQPTKLILLADPEERDRLHGQFSAELGGQASISKSDPEYLEVMAPGVTKGSTLPVLARHLGLTTDEVLAIGDADNDKEMIQAAGVGVAVANAVPEVRSIAGVVTERDNNQGAVAEAVWRFALR
jgi:hypothetical protein